MTEQELRTKVVNTARGWLGARQGDQTHRKIIDLYNSYKPLPGGYRMGYTDPWCAATVSALSIQNGITGIMPVECSCSRMIALYQKMGRWQENDAFVPQPGDLVMYDWDDTGKGDCTGAPEHVGLVAGMSGNVLSVIEGNKNKAVGLRAISVNGRYIRGYCLPDYAAAAGAYLQPVPARYIDEALSGTWVTKCETALRTGPGKQYPAVTRVPASRIARNYGYYSVSGGEKWLYVALGNATGYLPLEAAAMKKAFGKQEGGTTP